MSIRHLALYTFVAGLSIYAWKDWFKSLCGLILLMAVIEHEDMPKTMFGIQGLNMWNVLFVMIFLAWIASRQREGLRWDMPRHINVLLLLYLGVILLGVVRAILDRSYIQHYPLKSLISEELINTIKWALPGILLFDGCRTRKRVILMLVCLLVMYFLLSVQVARRLPPSSIFRTGGEIMQTRKVCGDIGYGACTMSALLAGTSWAVLAVLPLIRRKKYRILALAASGFVTYSMALTGGRAGYLAWGATGLVLCILRWRKYLILVPVVAILLPIVFPGAVERMLMGFGETNVAGDSSVDIYEVSSGRLKVWPWVVDKISESPIVGYGRLAMSRTGLYNRMELEGYTGFSHPHNMYLETLLDNGILGSLPIFLFWATAVVYGAILFRSSNALYSAVGCLCLGLVLSQLFAGIGSLHFYPEEDVLGVWAAMLLAMRVYVEEKRASLDATQARAIWNPPLVAGQQAVAFAQTDGVVPQ